MTKRAVLKFPRKRELNKDVKSKYLHKFISPKELEEMKEDPYELAMNNEGSLNDIIDEYIIKDPRNCRRHLDFNEELADRYE